MPCKALSGTGCAIYLDVMQQYEWPVHYEGLDCYVQQTDLTMGADVAHGLLSDSTGSMNLW